MTPQRFTEHAFQGLFNFRDMSGLTVSQGQNIKSNVLFRSDSFEDATETDVQRLLNVYRINRVIDLRTDRELANEKPSPLSRDGVSYRHRVIDSGPGSAIENAPPGSRLALRYVEYFDYAKESIVSAVRDLAEEGSWRTVMHCRAGKDRTGVVTAVVLKLLGVSNDEIAEDYSLTALAMPEIMSRLRQNPTYAENVKKLPDEMYSATKETMLKFLDLASTELGTFESWLLSNGVTSQEIDQLRSNLLESSNQL
ncbi:TpbA-like domain containing protein [Candidatus Planktophila versatilis]|uniref:tyrosine-protein phosphatase n=1 Tax=Candidatus Planktophila versatilis TaxID=1884905 RepID=UPI003BEEFA8C